MSKKYGASVGYPYQKPEKPVVHVEPVVEEPVVVIEEPEPVVVEEPVVKETPSFAIDEDKRSDGWKAKRDKKKDSFAE